MERTLTLQPIGYLRTTANKRYEAPRQPGSSDADLPGRVILNEGHNFEQALKDLDGFSKIWLIYWFDRNDNWKPMVIPPRGPAVKRGVFATRAPYRPNPIGLSLVDLVEVKGRTIYVANVDLLDKTPILDIKPYLPYAEGFPDAKAGWLQGLADSDFAIHFDDAIPEALRDELAAQLRISLPPEFVESPETYPLPHPYRRLKRNGDGYELGLRDRRVDIVFIEGQIFVTGLREL